MFSGHAIGIMLKSMFPSIFARIELAEADGTIDKVNDLLKTLATNGTFDALKELAVKIDRHNELLERIATNGNVPCSRPDDAGHGGVSSVGLLEQARPD